MLIAERGAVHPTLRVAVDAADGEEESPALPFGRDDDLAAIPALADEVVAELGRFGPEALGIPRPGHADRGPLLLAVEAELPGAIEGQPRPARCSRRSQVEQQRNTGSQMPHRRLAQRFFSVMPMPRPPTEVNTVSRSGSVVIAVR